MNNLLRRAIGTLTITVACLSASAVPAAADVNITSAGPLQIVYLGEQLDCQVDHVGSLAYEFFGTTPGACGTFIALAGTDDPEEVFGPDVPAGQFRIPYVPVSQSPLTGTGDAGSPFQVVTVVDVGTTGLDIRQTDSYVVGNEYYRTDIEVVNSTSEPIEAVLYHAGDCQIADSDDSFGFLDPVGGGIYCSATANNSPPGWLEGFVPLSPDSQYVEGEYEAVWLSLDGSPLQDTCECDTSVDSGAGISWEITVPAGGSATRSLLTAFSAAGVPPPPPSEPPTQLELSPASATNTAGQEHCVTATARSASGAGTPDVTVRFSVSGANPASESGLTDATGSARLCYTGTRAGTDTIEAFADVNDNGSDDGAEDPGASASKTYVAAAPSALGFTPSVATNVVGTNHCMTATVNDAFLNPNAGVTVRFTVNPEGDETVVASGAVTTDASGRTQFCYDGPALARVDHVAAFADTDGSGTFNDEEPGFAGRKTWVLPDTNCGVKITGAGWISTDGGWAHLNINVKTKKKQGLEGKIRYAARGLSLYARDVDVMTCDSSGHVTLFGSASVNGSGAEFRIDLAGDTARVRTDTGYDSGTQQVARGNIKVHKK